MQHPNSNHPRTPLSPSPHSRHDVYVTVGDPDPSTRDQMLDDIETATRNSTDYDRPLANTRAKGVGVYEDYTEHSGFLLYTSVTYAQALLIKGAAIATAKAHNQDAVGVAIIPANSALIPTNQD